MRSALHNIIKYYNDATYEDECSRGVIECEFLTKLTLNQTSDLFNSFLKRRNCECEQKFHKCIHGIEEFYNYGTRAGMLGFVSTLIWPKCYSVNYPIVKCEKFQYFFEPNATFTKFPKDRGTDTIRCLEYKLDKSKPKIYQDIFDVPFQYQDLAPEILRGIEQIRRDLIMMDSDKHSNYYFSSFNWNLH